MLERQSKQQGFSLVELMVATGVLGLLALALSQLTTNQMKSVKTVEKKFETTTVLEDIRTVLSDQESCSATFLNMNAKNTAAGVATSILRMVGGAPVVRFQSNAAYATAPSYGGAANVRIHSFRLNDSAASVEAPTGSEGTTHLIVVFHGDDPTKPNKTYASKIEKRIALNVRTNGTNGIVNCSAAVADNSENDFNLVCQGIGGTPNQPDCDLAPFPGLPAPGDNSVAVSTQYLNDWWTAVSANVVRKDPNLVEVMRGQLVMGGTAADGAGGLVINRGHITMAASMYIQMNSDRRLKKNIKTLPSVISHLERVKPRVYVWRNSGETAMGFIAQELQEIFPELVSVSNDGIYSVDYIQMTPVLVKGLQELAQENRNLKSQLKKSNKQVNMMKDYLCHLDPKAKFCFNF